MSPLLVVAAKELRDAVRDRRSLALVLLFPLLGPLVSGFVFRIIAEDVRSASSGLTLPVLGREHAPALMHHLRSHGVKPVAAPADARAAVRDRTADVVLVVPKTFPDDVRAGAPARVELVLDASRNDVRAKQFRVEQLVEAYGASVARRRLLARGIAPEVAVPLDVVRVDVSTARQRGATLLAMIPMFLLIAALVSGMNVAIDATAGERERGSLEPLLLNPVPRWQLVFGKWLVVVAFSMLGTLLTLVFYRLSLIGSPLHTLGIRMDLTPEVIVGILAACLPVAPLFAGVQLLAASFARSYKEAQTASSLLLFLPMLPGLIVAVRPVDTEPWMYFVPMLSQQVLLTDVLRGDVTNSSGFFIAGGVSLLAGVAATLLTARLFRSERIVFGR